LSVQGCYLIYNVDNRMLTQVNIQHMVYSCTWTLMRQQRSWKHCDGIPVCFPIFWSPVPEILIQVMNTVDQYPQDAELYFYTKYSHWSQ
jgi:hypothetical protein